MSIERISTIQTASVITQPTDAVERPMMLIEKLEREVKRLSDLKAKEKPDSLEYMFLGHHIVATVNAINIVEQHSEWLPVSELKLTEDDYGKDFIAYECEYFKTTGRATYQDGGYWRFDCARGYCAFANISHVIPIPKFQPPSEVQNDM